MFVAYVFVTIFEFLRVIQNKAPRKTLKCPQIDSKMHIPRIFDRFGASQWFDPKSNSAIATDNDQKR